MGQPDTLSHFDAIYTLPMQSIYRCQSCGILLAENLDENEMPLVHMRQQHWNKEHDNGKKLGLGGHS